MVAGAREPDDDFSCSSETVGELSPWAAAGLAVFSSERFLEDSVTVSESTLGEGLSGGIASSGEVSSAPVSGGEVLSAVFSESISCTPKNAPVIPPSSK